jgi:hypothetical protein
MSPRLIILALLILSIPVFSCAQSLGDVARETRAEEQKDGAPHPKAITNDDIARARERDTSAEAAKPSSAAMQAGKPSDTDAAELKNAKPSARPKSDTTKKQEAQEPEAQQRTGEINKNFLDRIALLRQQINTARMEVTKLQGDYEGDWDMPPYTEGDYAFRELQRQAFNQHISDLIETQRKFIASLESQLNDVQEAARHAGVPHATD